MPSRGGSRGVGGGGSGGRRPTVVPLQRSRLSSGCAGGHVLEPEKEYVPSYNSGIWTPEDRWNVALRKTEYDCKGKLYRTENCQWYLELLEDCPQWLRDKYKVPPLPFPNRRMLNPPLIIPDPPDYCKWMKSLLKECREGNFSRFDEGWSCEPFEDSVEEQCRPKA